MPTRIIKPYKRGKVSVSGYKQKYKSSRGPEPKKKIARSLRYQSRTSWLKDRRGLFTGRAGPEGETTSRTHVRSGKDYTGNLVGKHGRVYGRYESGAGQKRYAKELKKAHPNYPK